MDHHPGLVLAPGSERCQGAGAKGVVMVAHNG
jgi:hypothetical protein